MCSSIKVLNYLHNSFATPLFSLDLFQPAFKRFFVLYNNKKSKFLKVFRLFHVSHSKPSGLVACVAEKKTIQKSASFFSSLTFFVRLLGGACVIFLVMIF